MRPLSKLTFTLQFWCQNLSILLKYIKYLAALDYAFSKNGLWQIDFAKGLL